MSQEIFPEVINGLQERVLIAFCNQTSSPFHSLCVIDMPNKGARWIDLSRIPETFGEAFAGICGVCRVGNDLVIATQGAKPVIAIVDLTKAIISEFVPLAKCRDTHSLVFHEGHVYAVSTGTNEIYRVPMQDGKLGTEELFWQFPGVRYALDEIHLNGFTVEGGRFIASCFGEKNDDGSWGANGMVFYLDTGEVIRQGLRHPHTPLVVGDRLFFAESAAHKVFGYIKSEQGKWELDKEIQLGGYTRGLAFTDGRLLVGISARRKVSRSQKTINADPLSLSDSDIIAVDMASGKQEVVAILAGYGREVYDVLALPGVLELGAVHDAAISRIKEMESTFDRYVAELGRVWLQYSTLQNAILQKNEALEQLQNSLSQKNEALEQLQNSLSWRITAPLRYFRGLWARFCGVKQNTKDSP